MRRLPFTQYRSLLQSNDLFPRSARGYDNQLLFWDRLKEISDVSDRYDIENDTLRNTVISAGPCPGSWRVYYATVSRAEHYEGVVANSYLGFQIRSGLNTHDLGKMFERWVDEANEKFNSLMATGNISALNTIPGALGDYYRQQGTAILNDASQEERETYIMEISPEMQLSLRPPVRVNPDGLFPYGKFGAVFESKLSEPKHPEFIHQSAICALATEKVREIDVDYAIVLHSSYPNGQIAAWFKEIPDSAIERVTSNLESFLHLLQYSEIQRAGHEAQPSQPESGTGRLINRILRLFRRQKSDHLKSWKEFVVRPAGLPDEDLRAPCPGCPYKEACFKDGASLKDGSPNE